MLLLLAAGAAPADDWRYTSSGRVVAFADVHGAYEELVALLRQTGVIDAALQWTGGTTHLVSTGDLLDRGPRSRDAMELLMRLQDEAVAAGGRVHVVLGNHELMILTGDLRYVSAGEFRAFAGDEPAGAREAAWRELSAGISADADDASAARAAFDRQFPPGYFGLRAAFAPTGRYGHWLLQLPLMIVVDETAYTHGGLSPLVAELGLVGINRELKQDLVAYVGAWHRLQRAGLVPMTVSADEAIERLRALDEAELTEHPDIAASLRSWQRLSASDLFDDDGPLWYRGSALCHPALESPLVDAALKKIDARRVVVGHSPTRDHRVDERLGGRVIVLDTGMLASHYGGVPAALVFDQSEYEIVYAGDPGTEVMTPVDVRLSGAEVLSHDADTGRVRLQYEGTEFDAVFLPRRSHPDYRHEIAAWKLDQLLGLGLVVPAVERKIDGRTGALRLQPPGAIDEIARAARNATIPAWCAFGNEFELMYAFDTLALNEGRTRSGMLYTGPNLSLQITGFSRAFSNRRGLPAYLGEAELSLSMGLAERLERLDSPLLERELDGLLNRGQIRAILKRRDQILDTWPLTGMHGQMP